MEGTLMKWTNYMFGYKDRYFVLRNGVLYYYLTKGDKPRGRVHLSIATINLPKDEVKFDIDSGVCIWHLKAGSPQIRDDWIRAIKLSKAHLETKIQPDINCTLFDNETNRNYIENDDRLLTRLTLFKNQINTFQEVNKELEQYIKESGNNDSRLLGILDRYKVI